MGLDALWDWNLASNRVHFSPRWVSLVGCEDHEIGNTPEEWLHRVHPEDLGQVLREIEAARAHGPCEFDFRHRLRHKDGTYRWMSCRGVVVRNEGGPVIRLMGSHSDVTVNTVTDSLTGLPNRLLLLDRLSQSIDRAHRYPGFHFAVLLLDLGRPPAPAGSAPITGDPLLTAAARRLETCLRIGDPNATLRHNDLVARLQGDQFTILLDGLKDVSHAKVVADRILEEVIAPFSLRGREVFLSPSIGIAVSATGYTRAEDVLRDAEAAVHRARVLGGSHCEVFDTAILKSEQTEVQLAGDFANALERREFHLLYQPIVSLAANQVIGFEALVRWHHPVLGIIPPLDFIPIAERTGFIVPLGHWILREACLQLRAWQESEAPSADLWMSVNVSSVQLKHPALVEQIVDALRDSALDASSLVLELTEGIAMDNPTAVRTLLMQLRAMGVRISIDDFGTGYSSLAYLRQFPVDALKVDRSFVRDMATHKDTAEIVGSLTAMAQQLGLHVIAEGVENEEQLALLRSIPCESAQGYLFARPLDVNAAAEMLKTGLPARSGRRPDQGSALTLQSARPVLKLQVGARPLPDARWRSLSAAALTLLACGGVVALIDGLRAPAPSLAAPPSAGPALAPSPLANAEAPQGGGLADAGSVIQPSKVVTVAAAPVTPSATSTPVRTNVSDPTPPPPVVRRLASFNVVHLHRVGSCEGRLVVSADGVEFVPDEKTSRDTFALKHSEFLPPTLAEGRLTIRSSTRTYRFKAPGAAGEDETGSELRDVLASLARHR